jgi:hypothetical protein
VLIISRGEEAAVLAPVVAGITVLVAEVAVVICGGEVVGAVVNKEAIGSAFTSDRRVSMTLIIPSVMLLRLALLLLLLLSASPPPQPMFLLLLLIACTLSASGWLLAAVVVAPLRNISGVA